jgi:hypothetical protein
VQQSPWLHPRTHHWFVPGLPNDAADLLPAVQPCNPSSNSLTAAALSSPPHVQHQQQQQQQHDSSSAAVAWLCQNLIDPTGCSELDLVGDAYKLSLTAAALCCQVRSSIGLDASGSNCPTLLTATAAKQQLQQQCFEPACCCPLAGHTLSDI